jgi:hypothetical protein
MKTNLKIKIVMLREIRERERFEREREREWWSMMGIEGLFRGEMVIKSRVDEN